jgi:hypothetical protein
MKKTMNHQRGMGLLALLLWIALLGSMAIVGMKAAPIVMEYFEIKKAVNMAKLAGDSGAIRSSFDQQSKANYIESFSGRDLTIENSNGLTTISFAYKRTIHLAGPVSLLFDFSGKELVR